jgi:DNA-binding NarL/FixJ family response regulator
MSQAPGVRGRALLLVRSAEQRSAIAQRLRGADFEVLTYDDAAAAMIRLRTETFTPDVVLLDWALAGWSSAEFLRHFVSRPKYVRTAVVVLCDRDRSEEVPSLCVSSVLSPSANAEQVAIMIERVMPQHEQAAPPRFDDEAAGA